jgi:coenzyme F420-reducing hydrogenase alpha subunit
MTTRILGPFNRVEGDLEVHLDIADGRVAAARVNSPLYRGFEQMLPGKSPLDALVIVPRICGICSVAQSAAAAAALRDLMGLTPPPNGRLAEHLIGACENLADHLTHFYLFFMPDFARPAYQSRPWFPAAEARFKAVSGSAANDVLPARAEFMHLMGLMAGKWPHTLSLQPGGTSRPLEHSEILRLITLLRGFRRFLERHTFGDDLEAVAGLDSLAALDRWREGRRATWPSSWPSPTTWAWTAWAGPRTASSAMAPTACSPPACGTATARPWTRPPSSRTSATPGWQATPCRPPRA